MTPSRSRSEFIKLFRTISPEHRRLRVFENFVEMAALAIRKLTVSLAEGDAMERRYMEIVKQHEPDDIRKMPELLALVQLGITEDDQDFLGVIACDLELLNEKAGQIFTPWHISSLMATMVEASAMVAEKGFITLSEPTCGAGGMVLAAAKVMRDQGIDPAQHLFVDAADIQHMAFNMAYLQLSLSDIPAVVRRGNTIAMQFTENALTPAFFPFYAANKAGFDKWRAECIAPRQEPAPATKALPAPVAKPRKPKGAQKQMTLFC
jgi:type I restriction-modification system DNA methylase subunit